MASPNPIQVVSLEMPGQDIMRMVWQVSLLDDGSLVIHANGRRCGRIQVEPNANNMITVSTDKLIRARRAE